MLIIPIRTDVQPRKPPVGNYALIAANVLIFLITDGLGVDWIKDRFALNAAIPSLSQYVTYQFLHGDWMHLLGNMLFLWIFGNAVCDRMGSAAYLVFYLAGGVFAGFAFSMNNGNPLLGASGAIAAVTTAFLVLYPRVHVTMLLWLFVLVYPFQVPSMLLIVFKIILWDNVLAPSLEGGVASSVAYDAHLAGYLFGFLLGWILLVSGALARNQFDLLAVWGRWRRRSGLPPIAFPQLPRSHPVLVEEVGSRPIEHLPLSPAERLREDILNRLAERDFAEAVHLYLRLTELDPASVLPRAQQLEIGNQLAQRGHYAEAVRAYESLLESYPTAADAPQIRLLLGMLCNRYLEDRPRAAGHLRKALDGLTLDAQRVLAVQELTAAESGDRP